MTINISADQVSALAPDDASVKSGKQLAVAGKWQSLGANDRAVWGECPGSGKKPYQARIDMSEPAYKCSCPSRKFPCKHALGLLYLYASDKNIFKEDAPPGWVEEWLENRREREQKKRERVEKKTVKKADPKTRAKREEKRREMIAAGLDDLNLWLCDILRSGLSELESKPQSFWSEIAARMVDSQAPGLAGFIEKMQSCVFKNDANRAEQMLAVMGKLKLVIEGFSRYDSLPENLRNDIRTVLGWPLEKEDVLANQPVVRDIWQVLGMSIDENDRLREQRIWIHGNETGKDAVILNFAYGNQMLDVSLIPGTAFDGEIVYYPNSFPLRALEKKVHDKTADFDYESGHDDFQQSLDAFSDAVSVNPWIYRFPMSVNNVRPFIKDGDIFLRDSSERDLSVAESFPMAWELLAISGGKPLNVFGEWESGRFMPLSCRTDRFHNLFRTGKVK